MHCGRTNRQIIMALAVVLDHEEDLKLYHAWRTGLLAGRIASAAAAYAAAAHLCWPAS